MTHIPGRPVPGDFKGDEEKSGRPCPECGAYEIYVLTWESSDGGYEDERFTCRSCGHVWWVDGIDS